MFDLNSQLTTYHTAEELRNWKSIQKTLYLLFPLLLYFVVSDISDVLLWAFVNMLPGWLGANAMEVLLGHADSIKAIVFGISTVISMLFIRKMAVSELFAKNMDSAKNERKSAPPKGSAKGKDKRTSKERVIDSFRIRGDYRNCVYTLLAGIGLSLGLNILFSLCGFTAGSKEYTQVATAQYGVAFVLGILLYGILSPLAEELIFRAILLNRLKRIFPLWIGIGISSFLFGAYHMNLVQGVYGTLMGVFIGLMYEKTENFFIPVLFHAGANVVVYICTYGKVFSRISNPILWIMTVLFLILGGLFFFLTFFGHNKQKNA